MEQLCFKDIENTAFVCSGAFEPTSEYQSVSIQVPSQMLLRTHSRYAGSARLHITQRQLAIHTHTCNHAYVGAKASLQINLSAKLLRMDSILQETALCLCRLPVTQHTAA